MIDPKSANSKTTKLEIQKSKIDKTEIDNLDIDKAETARYTAEPLEKYLYKKIPILDHGFIRLIDYMGGDESIVQAARVSYGKGTKKMQEDRNLIRYLMRHSHTTPFEMCEIKFHIKLPIFVARQWIRHRTANVNEYSARYSILSNEFYIPKNEHLAAQSSINKQGREESLSQEEIDHILEVMTENSKADYEAYQKLLNYDEVGNIINDNFKGLARELARVSLGVNFYTEWYWKIDLHNLLHFLNLRSDSHAQFEICCYADAMIEIVKNWVPITYQAFLDYRKNSAKLSSQMLNLLKNVINYDKFDNIDHTEFGLSKREWNELKNILG